jgi:hypothetical protein
MPIAYDPGWDSARASYQENQVALDLYTEDMVSAALWKKNGCGEPLQELVNAAFKYPNETVHVEHDPSASAPPEGGGETFALALLVTWRNGPWHLGLVQDPAGGLRIDTWSGQPPRRKVVRKKQYYFGPAS